MLRRTFWLIIVASVMLSGLVAFDLAPWQRGEYRHFWPYTLPLARQLWPFLTLTGIYVIALVVFGPRLARSEAAIPLVMTLVGFALTSILLQLAALYILNPQPLSELFRRTVSPGAGGFFTAALTLESWSDLFHRFLALMPTWDAHPQRHPPGWPALFLGGRLLLNRFPDTARWLALSVQLDQCHNGDLIFLDNAQLASAWVGMALPGLAAATLVWPVYEVGRRFYNRQVGWWAAAWTPLVPTLIVFAGAPNQLYPLLGVTALLTLWHGLKARRRFWIFMAGGLISISTFLSFTNLIMFGPLGFLLLLVYVEDGQDRKWDITTTLIDLICFGLGTSLLWLGYWLASGVTPWDIWRVASQFHFSIDLPYWPWLWLNMQDFFNFGGWVLNGLSLLGLFQIGRDYGRKRRVRPVMVISVALWASLALLLLSGLSEGEVSRVWSPYLPLLLVSAAAALTQIDQLCRRFGLVTIILALNLVVIVSFLQMVNPRLSEPPRLPPIEPARSAIPLAANFADLAELEGYTLTLTTDERGQSVVDVTLNWRALARFDRAYHVFVHLLAADGTRIAQSDTMPANLAYPTTCWQPGQRLGDPHRLTLPPEIPAGVYNLQIGLFWLATGERLVARQVGLPEQDFVEVRQALVVE